MSNLRRGRPPRVVETERGFATRVKGETYEFKQADKGNRRPVNTRNGNAEDRAYAKPGVRRATASRSTPEAIGLPCECTSRMR